MRNFVTNAVISNNLIEDCGIYDFQYQFDGKIGEAVYIGTSSNQVPGCFRHGLDWGRFGVQHHVWESVGGSLVSVIVICCCCCCCCCFSCDSCFWRWSSVCWCSCCRCCCRRLSFLYRRRRSFMPMLLSILLLGCWSSALLTYLLCVVLVSSLCALTHAREADCI